MTHVSNHLRDPAGWVFYGSPAQPRRLIVFVHGFRGNPRRTWGDFPSSGSRSPFFRDSDMLYVGYDSQHEQVVAIESRLRKWLPRFFPRPPIEALVVGSDHIRTVTDDEYEEIILVGHSLGGLILRRLLTEIANPKVPNETCWERSILGGRVVLFSPATHGYQPSGLLGSVSAIPMVERLMLIKLRASPAFNELQRECPILLETRSRTERLARRHPELGGFRAATAWASPENVVLADRYNTDPPPQVIYGKSHIAVCKPKKDYATPIDFVESGMVP